MAREKNDWKKIVGEIKACGVTQSKIAAEIGIGDATLSELCSGKIAEPKWSKGDALLALHEKVTGLKAA